MGSLKGMALIFLAALFAAGAGGLIYVYFKGHAAAPAAAPVETTSLVVAAKDISFGTKLTPEDLALVAFPKEAVPDRAYTEIDSVAGQTTKVFLVKGEPVLAPKLSTVGGGLSVRIPESLRASSVKVNEVSGVSGFILPGDRVDVLATFDNIGQTRSSVTRTILQDLEVLASGVQTATKNNKPVDVQAVTLLLDPQGAEALALALHQGEIHLVLRNPADHEIVEVDPTSTSDLMKKARPAPAPRPVVARPQSVAAKADTAVNPPPPPERKTYTIIRDGTVKEEKFPARKPAGS
jgi:pilus assembly protein CpaB